MTAPRHVCLAALIAFAPALGAQQTTPSTPPAAAKTGKAQIIGVVIDSLDGKYLSNADVIIEGAKTSLVTDSLGKFEIDTLSPGTYQVGVFHPLLDTLNIALASKPFHVGPDSSSFVVLAVPSAATIVHEMCPAQEGARGKSAVIGHVNDPETLRPVAQAEVSVAWTEIDVSKELGIRRTGRLVHDTTDQSGAFKICGLPSSLQATLQARRGSAVTAEIPFSLGEHPIELLARTLLLSAADSTTKVGTASVSGIVLLEGSAANGGSRVELVGTDIVAITNDKGEFTMHDLPSGSKVLLARHLGFGAETAPVDLSSREEKHVTMKLAKFVAVMDPILVTARRSAALDKIGFSQRKKGGAGFFIGPDRLDHMHPTAVTDILRMVPGLRVSYGPHGDVVSSSRGGGGCVQYYLDDMPYTEATPGDITSFVSGGEVVAVEVYQDTNTPPQYTRAGTACTTIVLWTRFKVRS